MKKFIMTQQVPRLTAFLRANGGGSGALDAGALYLQRKQAMQARLGTRLPGQVSLYTLQGCLGPYWRCTIVPDPCLVDGSETMLQSSMWGYHAASKAIRGQLPVPLMCVMLQAGQGGRSALAQKLLGPWVSAPRSARADFTRYLQLVARLLGGEASSQEVEVGCNPCTASHSCPSCAEGSATACQ